MSKMETRKQTAGRTFPALTTLAVLFTAGIALLSEADEKGTGAEHPAAPPIPDITWKDNILTITAEGLPGGTIEVWYLEAYCRPGSTDREWGETVIDHKTEYVESSPDRKNIRLRCTLNDGVIVNHLIRAIPGGVEFSIEANNPTENESEAHWAQPCIRVGEFTGTHENPDKYSYIKNCYVYLDGEMEFLPTRDWATEARYVPGQVWAAPGIDRDDVNPRPLSKHRPSNGLIGCISGDKNWTMAVAFEPYQELFQGVIRCIHNDFRIGGLEPGETKKIRGKIYLQPGDPEDILKRYREDFPEQAGK